jgi:DNA-binding SARP family transcriptional activator/tetratricopeptide (TPR) repeat protein
MGATAESPGTAPELRVQLLGPVRAWLGEQELELGPPLRRCLFTVLTMRQGRAVPLPQLIAALWGDNPPATAAGSVHTYVAGLRQAFEPDPELRRKSTWLRSEDGGYRLDVNRLQVDAHRFEELNSAGRRLARLGKLADATARFTAAAKLWQGTPFHGIPGPFAKAERIRLVELGTVAAEERARALLDLDTVDTALADELTQLVTSHPLRESLREVLMLTLYRLGRQADALQHFHDARRVLADELGVRPSASLQDLYERMIVNEPGLDSPRTADGQDTTTPRPLVPAQLPHQVTNFVHRDEELAEIFTWLDDQKAEPDSERARVLVVEGTPGVGKTALAVHAAHRLAERFPDGQIYLELGGVGSHQPPMSTNQVLTRLLKSLGQPTEETDAEVAVLRSRYQSRIRGKKVLILLDDVVSAEQVTALLPGTSSCLVIVTCRHHLGRLTAGNDVKFSTLDVLTPEHGQALLSKVVGAERVAAEPEAARRIVELCVGLPLALRIAAARAVQNRALELAELADDLADSRTRLDMLEVPEDDRTAAVRLAFSSSYRELCPGEARLFRMLGLLPTGTFSDLAMAALAGQTLEETRHQLAEHLNVHLINELGAGRFRLNDLLLSYAAEQSAVIDSPAERVQARQRLLDWYIHSAEAAGSELNPGKPRPDEAGNTKGAPGAPSPRSPGAALSWFDAEFANLDEAVKLAFGAAEYQRTWQLAAGMSDYLLARQHWQAATTLYGLGIEAAERLGDRARELRLRVELGIVHLYTGRLTQAIATFTVARAWADAAGDRYVHALGTYGLVLAALVLRPVRQGVRTDRALPPA